MFGAIDTSQITAPFTSAAPAVASTTSTSSTSSSSGGFLSGLGATVGSLFDTGAGFLSGLAQISLFNKAQDAGLAPNTTTGTSTGSTNDGNSGIAAPSSGGLPGWAIPAGIGVAVLLVAVLMFKR